MFLKTSSNKRFVHPGMTCSLDLNFSFLPTMFLPAAPNMDFLDVLFVMVSQPTSDQWTLMGKPTATDIMKPTRIISVTRLEGKCMSTLPSVASVKLT